MQYYIQDTRSFVGDSVLFWRPDGSGYTIKIDRAGLYTEADAKRICRNRDTDKMIPEDVVKRAATLQVTADDLWKAQK